jgi:hypothetical protein
MKYWKQAALTMVTLFAVSCGGGGGGVSTSSATEEGVFVDAPVKGIEYTTSSGISGYTDENGTFRYREGDNVTFKIGNITLGTVKGASLVTPLDLVGTTDVNNQNVKDIVALLLYLDDDNNPDNGITIDVNKVPKLNEKIDLANATTLPEELQDIVNNPVIDPVSHLNETISEIVRNYIQGTYKGSYTTEVNPQGYCDPGGSVSLTIDENGNGVGSAVSSPSGYLYELSGKINYKEVNLSGIAQGIDGSATFEGEWDNNCIYGHWRFVAVTGEMCEGSFRACKQQ